MTLKIRNCSRLVLALIPSMLMACATTRMTSQANPEVAGRGFTKVLSYGNFQALEHRQQAEEKLCSELVHVSHWECLQASHVFFPGQAYSAEQIAARLTDLGIDGVLTLQPVGSGTSSSYIPQSSYTTGTASVSGNTVTGSSTTQTYGGYNVSKPWANLEAVLWSVADGQMAWYATATSKGNAFADWDDLIRSAAGKTASQLRADGISR